jgi:glycosyltransferase involved in cell wall biosynthesis
MEAMPVSWLEVLAMGKALVGSQLGPGREVIIDGFNGILCDPKNPKDIAQKVIYLLENKEVSRRVGENARLTVEQNFNLDKLVQDNIAFYTGLK